jgi:radical SAM superfamily enzyme YgiQ (UPF0313 family)
MRILLVLPAVPAYRVQAGGRVPRRAMLRFSVLPLTTVAALTPPEHEVTLCDENVSPIDFDVDVDLVGVSFMTAYAPRAYEIAAEFRRRGRIVVAGGHHPTFCVDEVLGYFDAIVRGDAEGLWPQLLADANAGTLQRVYDHASRPDLADSPPPRRELTRPWKAHYATLYAVQTGRGCRHKCRFCAVTAFHGATYRHKPVAQVIEEIRGEPKGFIFVDDNIISDPAYSRELFEAMVPLKKCWSSQCTLRIADDPSLLALAKRAGCMGVFVGLESIKTSNLAAMDKSVNVERDSATRIRAIRAAGIAVAAGVIVGLDRDGPNAFRETLAFLVAHRLDSLQLSILTPLPGTPLDDDFRRKGRIVDDDWSHYDFRHAVFTPARMTREELQAGADWLYRQFYRLDRVLLRAWRTGRIGGLASAIILLRVNLTYRYDNIRERIIGYDPARRKRGHLQRTAAGARFEASQYQ